MTAERDWFTTVWRASFKGFPFYFDTDEEEGGRQPIIHKFPNRDDPYLEDLGEEPRTFSGQAYVHGDDADAQAGNFIALLAARGPGVLVIPTRGPVLVRAMPFKRRSDKDKSGLIAFEVKFVREGAATALISLGALGNGAFGAIDALAAGAVAAFAQSVTVSGVSDAVAVAVYDTVAQAAATLDAQRISHAVDPDKSSAIRDALTAIVAATAENPLDVAPLATNLIAAARDLSDAMPDPAIASGAMLEMADAFAVQSHAPAYLAPTDYAIAANIAAASRLARLAALSGYADAVMRRTFTARPDGVNARAEVAMRLAAELDDCAGAENAELFVAIQDMLGAVVEYLSKQIADLAPVVTVDARRQLPALYWAWRLYGDPNRAGELVSRNQVRHPAFMPQTFFALAR